jgi:hypothetical protein
VTRTRTRKPECSLAVWHIFKSVFRAAPPPEAGTTGSDPGPIIAGVRLGRNRVRVGHPARGRARAAVTTTKRDAAAQGH